MVGDRLRGSADGRVLYASGMRYHGRYSWMNRFAFPFRAPEIAALLDERLAPQGRLYGRAG